MNITLRKASTLQASIIQTLSTIDFEACWTTELTEFEDIEDNIKAAIATFELNVERRSQLMTAMHDIRANVGRANFNAKIDMLLAELNIVEKDIQFYQQYSSWTIQPSLKVLNGRMDKIRNAPEPGPNQYHRTDTIKTSVITQDMYDSFKSRLSESRKHKQELQDKLMELNVRNCIILRESTVETLTKENII